MILMKNVCPVPVRQQAEPACLSSCPFQLERQGTLDRLRLIKSALEYDRDHSPEDEHAMLDSKLGALATTIEAQGQVAETAARSCQLPRERRAIAGLIGPKVIRCSSDTAQNYNGAVGEIDYSPVSEALSLLASRPLAQEFLESAMDFSGIEIPYTTREPGDTF